MRVLSEVAAVSIATFAAIVGGYAFFSFLFARGHVPRRGVGATLRELVREAWLVTLTQPLLPLYYVVGDRMAPFLARPGDAAPPSRVPVVLVHGYMQNRVGFIGLARMLAKRGLGPLYAINYPWFGSIPANAKRLERYVARVCRETKSPAVDLVCHSMGGLVAMEMMRSTAKKEELRVRRCVTIATPHAGVAWRGPMIGFGTAMLRAGSKLLAAHAGETVAVPTLSVFSTHDNVVYPAATASLVKRGGEDFEVAGNAHFSILFSSAVADQIAAFLSKPASETPPALQIQPAPAAAAGIVRADGFGPGGVPDEEPRDGEGAPGRLRDEAR